MLYDPIVPMIFYDVDGAPSGGPDVSGEDTEDQDVTVDEVEDTDLDGEDLELDGDYDPDRAKRTIAAQRKAEKELKAKLSEANKTLKAYKEAEAKAADAKKSELQKLTEKSEKLQAQLLEAQEIVQGLRLEKAFSTTAKELELSFASPQAASDAFDLVDLEGVTIDEDGKVKGLKKAVEALRDSRPYLFSDNGKASLGTPPRSKVPKTPPASPEGKQTETYPTLVKL